MYNLKVIANLIIASCCILGCLFLTSCNTVIEETGKEPGQMLEEVAGFQDILDSADLTGTILIYDPQKPLYYTNNFENWQEGSIPASTFKIPNSIIALESKVISDVNHIFKWNGEPRQISTWERDMNLTQAFHLSCVPCYQQIAREIGTVKMKEYLKKLDYGSISVSDSTIDVFWLEGESKISPWQQVDFLQRLHEYKLPISGQTRTTIMDMMILEQIPVYTLRGKTGWAIREGKNTGWFVGSLEVKKNTYYFATRVSPTEDFNMDYFPAIRKQVTMKALSSLNLIEWHE
jgi:beta-lactamase class D